MTPGAQDADIDDMGNRQHQYFGNRILEPQFHTGQSSVHASHRGTEHYGLAKSPSGIIQTTFGNPDPEYSARRGMAESDKTNAFLNLSKKAFKNYKFIFNFYA